MFPASNSKSKDKSTSKPVKEPKAHSIDHCIDLLEESKFDAAFEYDSVSNINSLSRGCNDLQKDGDNNSNTNNASFRTNSIPGSDPTKQEKIKLKNEKKHQKRKEKRAQELEEKCCSYLTSRKLESLAHHLVSMGFTSEAATAALIQNEGCLEASASWILDGGFERAEHSILDTCNKKIDISDELSKIKKFETRFKCSTLDVEKAVVACEGDLQKAEESLKAQFEKPEASSVSESLKENRNEPPTVSPASERTPPVSYTKPKSSTTTQQEYRPEKKTLTTTAAFATTTQVNQNAVPSPSEERRSASTTMGTPLQQLPGSALASKSNVSTQETYFHDQYHHMQYVPSLKKPPKGGFGYYDNMHESNASRSSLPPSGSSTMAWKVDWGSQKYNIPFCDYTNIDWSLDRAQIGLPPSSVKGERLYDKALHASSLFSSKILFPRSDDDDGEYGDFSLRRIRPWAP